MSRRRPIIQKHVVRIHYQTTDKATDPTSGLYHQVLFDPPQNGTFLGLSWEFTVFNNGTNYWVTDPGPPAVSEPWPFGNTFLWMVYRRRKGEIVEYPVSNPGPLHQPAEDLFAWGTLSNCRGPLATRNFTFQTGLNPATPTKYQQSSWERNIDGTVALVAGTGGPIALVETGLINPSFTMTEFPTWGYQQATNEVGGSTIDRNKGKITIKRKLLSNDSKILFTTQYSAQGVGIQAGVTLIGSVTFFYRV